jgi:uncharacterized surface protein with fasciclin (FAS1) repeats
MTARRITLTLVAATAVIAVAATAASARPAKERNLVATASAAGSFTTLTKLLKAAGLASTLRTGGPFTVFAPTDAAFAKVPKATVAALLADKAKLKAVLLYHVVSGRVTAGQVVKLTRAKTLAGKQVKIRVAGGNVFVNDARVTSPDVMATNGVIHVVDRVLLP